MTRPTTKLMIPVVVVMAMIALVGANYERAAFANGSGPLTRASGAPTPVKLHAAVASTAEDVFAIGDAGLHGSTGTMTLRRPIVGMAATPRDSGYWEVASDGGIFAFGDATFHGSTGNIMLNQPIAGMAATPTGNGYWLVASDGGIFAFGDATFHGSMASTDLASLGKLVVGIVSTHTGAGYWMVATPAPLFSVLYDSNATGNFEVYRRDLQTGAVTQLTSDRSFDSWWAKASPDGTRMIFYRTPAGVHDSDYKQTSLWMANIDGTGLRQLIANGQYGWAVQGHAEWSPDGTRLVMFGGIVYNGIVVTDTNGVPLHRVGTGIDSAWSSDGTQILYINCAKPSDFPFCPTDQYRIYAANEDGSSPHILVDMPVRANDPAMSPDGSLIAFETNPGGLLWVWDLWVANADGSNPHRILSDGNINSGPVWASNDQLIFYKTAPAFHSWFGVWSIRKDGSGLTWVSQGQVGIAEFPCPVQ